jgi:DNA-binding beta-propeller fold protein YncE
MAIRLLVSVLIAVGAAAINGSGRCQPASPGTVQPLEQFAVSVTDAVLGEKTSRIDYQSLDPTTGRLYVAGMGMGKLLVFDTKQSALVGQLENYPKITGVLAVPALHKVYASVPGAGLGASLSVALGMAGIGSGAGAVSIVDARSLHEIARLPGGVFPDGIAYDPDDGKVFVSDEFGGALTVVNAATDTVIERIDAGGELGNVRYDSVTKSVFVPVQSKNELAIIDPKIDRVVARVPLPGGKHPHGLHIGSVAPIGYVACDDDDHMLVVDLRNRTVLRSLPLGRDPDVLAEDPVLKRLYVASESGVLSVFDISTPENPREIGRVFVGKDAHSVAVDPESHRLFLPLADLQGKAVMRIVTPRLS